MISNKFTKPLGRKVRLGKLRFPLWAIGLAVIGMAVGAGQAVGPVLSGSVSGTANLTVAQTIVLAAAPADLLAVTHDYDGMSVTSVDSDDYAAVMNDEGTNFTVAMVTQVGQTTGIKIALTNKSGHKANFVLELRGPASVDIAADESGDDVSQLARLGPNTWIGELGADADAVADIYVVFEPKDDMQPGYVAIQGHIKQISG